MKIFANIVKILTALAAVAGAVYVIATYGDKIVAWAKQVLASFSCPECEVEVEVAVGEEAAEEAPAEEVAVEEPVAEEPAAEVVVEEPVAEEADFAE